MLSRLDPLLNAEVLHALRAMVMAMNWSYAMPNSRPTRSRGGRSSANCSASTGSAPPRAARAILSVMPLDTFVDEAALRMQVVGQPDQVLPVHQEVQAEIDRAESMPKPLGSIERMEFYERAKQAYCVIATGETRVYRCSY